MGINKLIPTLRKLCPNAITKITSLEQYRGKVFAIEVSSFMYKYFYRHKKRNENSPSFEQDTFVGLDTTVIEKDITDEELLRGTEFIEDFILQYKMLSTNGIKVIYVFDGSPAIEKQEEHEDRKRKRDLIDKSVEETKIKIAKLESIQSVPIISVPSIAPVINSDVTIQPLIDLIVIRPETIPIEQQIISLKKDLLSKQNRQGKPQQNDYDNLRATFCSMSIPYVDAIADGEQTCVLLCNLGFADVCVSDDTDPICFGAPITLLNLESNNRKTMPTQEVVLKKVLSGLGMTMKSFVDFCILCGCDYCGTIKGIGEMKAYKYILNYGSIEKFLDSFEGAQYKEILRKEAIARSKGTLIQKVFQPESARRMFFSKNIDQNFIDYILNKFGKKESTLEEKKENEEKQLCQVPLN